MFNRKYKIIRVILVFAFVLSGDGLNALAQLTPNNNSALRPASIGMPEEIDLSSAKYANRDWFLGKELSTQGVKFILVDRKTEEILKKWSINCNDYSDEFPDVKDGVTVDPGNGNVVYTNPLLFALAFFDGNEVVHKALGNNMQNIKGVGLTAQQHGAVFLNDKAQGILSQLRPDMSREELKKKIKAMLALDHGTSWQDGDTTEQQAQVGKAFGDFYRRSELPDWETISDEEATRRLTGSAPMARFTLLQILRQFEKDKDLFERTEMILNLSVFLEALSTGSMDGIRIDAAEACGMNAVIIEDGRWAEEVIEGLQPGLTAKLPKIGNPDEISGTISPYLAGRFNYNPETVVGRSTGDNLSSIVGAGLVPDAEDRSQQTKDEMDAVISFGTSTTTLDRSPIEMLRDTISSSGERAHIFLDTTGGVMRMSCFQNGGLALRQIRDEYITDEEALAEILRQEEIQISPSVSDLKQKEWKDKISAMKWAIFTELVEQVENSGNPYDGAVLIPMIKDEDLVKIPFSKGRYYMYNLSDMSYKNRAKIFHAAIAGQAYFIRFAMEKSGVKAGRIKVVGGGAVNPMVRQILANVLNEHVTANKEGETGVLGAALRVMKAYYDQEGKDSIGWAGVKPFIKIDETMTKSPSVNAALYQQHYSAFENLAQRAMQGNPELIMVSERKPTFDEVVEYLERFTRINVLKNGDTRVAVAPEYQARVMVVSTSGDNGEAFGWINRELLDSGTGKTEEAFYNVGGLERLWLTPEGTKFTLYTKDRTPLNGDTWYVPDLIDKVPWGVVGSDDASIQTAIEGSVTNLQGTKFDLSISRKVNALDTDAALQSLSPELAELSGDPSLSVAAFRSLNAIKNNGGVKWVKETGLIAPWVIGQFDPSDRTDVMARFAEGEGPEFNEPFPIAAGRKLVKNGVVHFYANGKIRGKFGIPGGKSTNVVIAYDGITGTLTIAKYEKDPNHNFNTYPGSDWDPSSDLYNGEDALSYSDGEQDNGVILGGFSEIEGAGPGLELKPGEEYIFKGTTVYVKASKEVLTKITQAVLGVSIHEIEQVTDEMISNSSAAEASIAGANLLKEQIAILAFGAAA